MDRLQGRSEAILSTIVAEFISTGEPVGSRTIAKKKGVSLSPASIRNIMSDLTEWGYITQPHVSAGRIPTDRGYRFYVDSILASGPLLPGQEQAAIEALIRAAGLDMRDMLRKCSSVLAGLSMQAGVVTATAVMEQRFRAIEFVKLAADRILVMLVCTGGLVQNKIILDDDGTEQETLERYSRMITDMLKDLDLHQARERIEKELEREKTKMDALLAKALRLGYVILAQRAAREIFIEGQTNILGQPEFADVEQLKALLTTFEEKSKLLRILDKTLEARGIQVFIGSEHGLDEIDTCAIIAYPIRTGEAVVGSIGVIGPKRMNYHKMVSLVDNTGQALTRVVKEIVESAL